MAPRPATRDYQKMQASIVRQLPQRLFSTMVAINGRAHAGPDRVEINVDCGQSSGMWEGGPDEELMPLIDAENIACGGHAGAPVVMSRTVALAKRFCVKVGACRYPRR